MLMVVFSSSNDGCLVSDKELDEFGVFELVSSGVVVVVKVVGKT